MYHMYRKALGWFRVFWKWIFHYLPAWCPFRRRGVTSDGGFIVRPDFGMEDCDA